MKILLSTGSLYNYGTNRIFEIAKKAGFDGIELIIDDRWDTRQPKYLQKLARQFNLPILAVHSAMEFVTCWGEDPKVKLEKSVELAKIIKAEFLAVHPSVANQPEFYQWFYKNWLEIKKNAKPLKVVVENMPKVNSIENPKDFVFENFNLKDFSRFDQILLDPSHLTTTDQDLLKTFEAIKEKIKYIHLSDSNFTPDLERPGNILDDHLLPGEGKLPLRQFLLKVKETNPQCTISIELLPESIGAGEDDSKIIARLKRGLKFIKDA